MTNATGGFCGLHFDAKRCQCAHHCTGCAHAYGPMETDCCTCCRDESGARP